MSETEAKPFPKLVAENGDPLAMRIIFRMNPDGKDWDTELVMGRPRAETTAAPTQAEKLGWAGYAAASMFHARRKGVNGKYLPHALDTLRESKRVPGGMLMNPEFSKEIPPQPKEAVYLDIYPENDEGGVAAVVRELGAEFIGCPAYYAAEAIRSLIEDA